MKSLLLLLKTVGVIFIFSVLTACGGGGGGTPPGGVGDGDSDVSGGGAGGNNSIAALTTSNVNDFFDDITLSSLFVSTTQVGTNSNLTVTSPTTMTFSRLGCQFGSVQMNLSNDAEGNFTGSGSYTNFDDCKGFTLDGSFNVSGKIVNGIVTSINFTFNNYQFTRIFTTETYKMSGTINYTLNPIPGACCKQDNIINANIYNGNDELLFRLNDFRYYEYLGDVFLGGSINKVNIGQVEIFTPILLDLPSVATSLWAGQYTISGQSQVAVVDINSGTESFSLNPFPVNNNPLDPSFADSGLTFTDFGNSTNETHQDLHILDNDSIIILGGDIVKYMSNGQIDPSFGTNGIAASVTPAGYYLNISQSAIVTQADGKILVAGTNNNSSNYSVFVVRYNSNGSLDLSFGNNGISEITSFNSSQYNFNFQKHQISIQSDDKIVLAGEYFKLGISYRTLARLNTNGSIDTSFGNNGIREINRGNGFGYVNDLIVQSDDKIISVGYENISGSDPYFMLMRFNADGSTDTTFGTAGIVNVPSNTVKASATGIKLLSTGDILVSGSQSDGSGSRITVAKYTSNGVLDANYGTSGIAETKINLGANSTRDIAIQSDGKSLVSATTSHGIYTAATLVRFNQDGTIDTSFGTNGYILQLTGSNDANNFSMALQSDGKVIMAGNAWNNTNNDLVLLRYQN